MAEVEGAGRRGVEAEGAGRRGVEAEGAGRRDVEPAEFQEDARAPVAPAPTTGVLLGAGGDPLVFGLPVFVSGSLVIGFVLLGVFVPSALFGVALPVTTFSTGAGELLTALWAIVLGQTMVATIFGLFAGFWFSLFALVMGLLHNWFHVTMAQAVPQQEMFLIAWLIIFVFLTVAILRLPLVYPLILFFVDLALLGILLALEFATSAAFASDALIGAGAAILAFCATGLWAFLHVASISFGGPPKPSLGPALMK